MHLVGGSLLESLAAGRPRSTTPAPCSTRDGALLAPLPQGAPVRRRHPRPRHAFASPTRGCAAREVVVVATDARHARPEHLLRPALSRALPPARRGRRARSSACRRRSPSPPAPHHWEILLRARAIENQVYVVAPNQIGRSPQRRAGLRPLADRRSVGNADRARLERRDGDPRRDRPRLPRPRAAGAAMPRAPHIRPLTPARHAAAVSCRRSSRRRGWRGARARAARRRERRANA